MQNLTISYHLSLVSGTSLFHSECGNIPPECLPTSAFVLTEFTMAARVILYKAGSAYVTPLFKTLNTSTIHSQRQLESPKSLWSPLHLFLSLHPSSPPSEYTGFRCVVASGFFTCSFCCWVFFSYV